MLEMTEDDLVVIKDFIDKHDFATAQRLLNAYLLDNPLDPKALFLLGRVLLSTDNQTLSTVLYDWLLIKHGEEHLEVLVNLMMSYSRATMYEEAVSTAKRLLEHDPTSKQGRLMVSTCNVQLGKYEEAIAQADDVLKDHPNAVQAHINKGFSYLHMREYGKGWDLYDHGIGFLNWRDPRTYDGEPMWDGRMGENVHVLVYSEQGVGDQIAGIEPLRELMSKVNVVALDCDPKMRTWFGRNFPELHMIDSKPKEKPHLPPGMRVDFSMPLFTMHKYLRKSEDDYSKKPFLLPDLDYHDMWRMIFERKAKGRPIIGISFSGGGSLTGKGDRRIDIDAFKSLSDKLDAYYVCMEYRDRDKEIAYMRDELGMEIDHFKEAKSQDYDDIASMISALDYFIAPPTAAVHAAGSLGTQTFCVVHKAPNIHYASFGDKMPYYGSVELLRRSEREDTEVIGEVADKILADCGEVAA